jgi:DNA-binding response OmpR family regulator
MAGSILDGKKILAVDDEPDVLDVLEDQILGACPNSQLDKATSYETAVNMLKSRNYDVVILDIMGVRGFDLLDLAVSRNLPVAMLTAHALNPEALKRSIEMGARAYLPKEKLGEIVPFLEDILEETEYLSGWANLMNKLDGYLIGHWGENWQRSDVEFWKQFGDKTSHIRK